MCICSLGGRVNDDILVRVGCICMCVCMWENARVALVWSTDTTHWPRFGRPDKDCQIEVLIPAAGWTNRGVGKAVQHGVLTTPSGSLQMYKLAPQLRICCVGGLRLSKLCYGCWHLVGVCFSLKVFASFGTLWLCSSEICDIFKT
jgi:hypothetical protein